MRFAILTVFALLALAGGAVAAPVPNHLKKGDNNPDRAALQGKWTLETISVDGKRLSNDTLDMELEFRGDALISASTSQNHQGIGTVTFDLTTKPRRMVFGASKVTDINGKPKNDPDAAKGGVVIYKIDGDTFIMASNGKSPGVCPESFEGKNGSLTVVMTFKRVKK